MGESCRGRGLMRRRTPPPSGFAQGLFFFLSLPQHHLRVRVVSAGNGVGRLAVFHGIEHDGKIVIRWGIPFAVIAYFMMWYSFGISAAGTSSFSRLWRTVSFRP